MISFFNVLMTVVFITVVAAAIGYGGRYERALAIVLVVSGVVGKGAQRLLDDYLPLGVFAVIDVAILASMFWLLWRVRPTWLLLMAGAQTSVLGLVAAQALGLLPSVWIYFHGVAVLNYVQLGCLAYAVVRRRLGPPFAAPARLDTTPAAS